MSARRSTTKGPRHALGIDFGLHTIKAAWLERTAEGPVLRHAGQIQTPAGALEKGVITRPREVASQLQSLITASGYPAAAASASVPMEHSLIRWIDLPVMDAESLRAATRFEARKYLPFPADQAEIEIVPVEPGGGKANDAAAAASAVTPPAGMHAMLIATPREVMGSRAETLEMAGLEVSGVEAEAFAMIRAREDLPGEHRGRFWRRQSVAYIQLGEESSGMCVVQDGQIRFVRAISWGGSRLTHALAQARNGSIDEARALKEHPETVVDEQGRIAWGGGNDGAARDEHAGALVPELDRVCREIQRLLNYYRSLYPERSYEGILNRVTLCGGTASLRGLDAYFSGRLQVQVKTRDPFLTRIARQDARAGGNGASFDVALGLALGQLDAAAAAAQQQRGGEPQPLREFVWRRRAAGVA